ncbi:MAG TPA: TetR family transcriptional regulator [Actinomycetota bacterium]|nr:TetR family transcriptional regulator [Actinomycetota bacterium]
MTGRASSKPPPGRASSKPPRDARARGDAWKSARRAELLDAADRVVRRLGPAASMDDFAAEAGITRVVLYRYFGDKGGLLQALAQRYVHALLDRLRVAMDRSDEPEERLAATVDAYLSFLEANREVYAFLMHRAIREGPEAQATVADFMRGVAREVGDVLAAEIARLGLDPSPAQAWGHGVVGMVHLAGDWWLEHRDDVPRARVVEQLVTLLAHGLLGAAAAGTKGAGGGAYGWSSR